MGVGNKRLTGKSVRSVVAKVRTHSPAALCAVARAGAGVAAQVGTMPAAVAKNLANRRGNIPASALFKKIPQGIRIGDENSILAYLRRRDVSHRVSIQNAPNRAGSVDNVVFETSCVNQVRGARNMSRVEMTMAHARNALDGLKVGLRVAPKAAARSGLIAGVLELPVSGAVNLIRYRRGRVSGKRAAGNIARDFVTTSLAGATAGAAMVVVAAFGVPITGPAVFVCSGVGVLAYGVSSVGRIHSATIEPGTQVNS